MSDPSVTIADAFKQFSQATVSAVSRPGFTPPRSVVQSLQLRAYEQGTRVRLHQAEDDLRALRHERDDALRDFNACKEETRAWVAEVDRWKAEARTPLMYFPSSVTYADAYFRRIEP